MYHEATQYSKVTFYDFYTTLCIMRPHYPEAFGSTLCIMGPHMTHPYASVKSHLGILCNIMNHEAPKSICTLH